MNVCELQPGEQIPEHDETGRLQEEVFVTLAGSPTIVIDGTEHPAPEGTFARLDPDPDALRRQQRHRTGTGADHLGADDERLRADGLGLSVCAARAAHASATPSSASSARLRSSPPP